MNTTSSQSPPHNAFKLTHHVEKVVVEEKREKAEKDLEMRKLKLFGGWVGTVLVLFLIIVRAPRSISSSLP